MRTLFAIVIFVIGYGVGTYAFSNILLPLLWAWPKARRLHREGRLTKEIPAWWFLASPLVWGMLVLGSLWLAGRFPAFSPAYAIGLVAGAAQVVRLIFRPNQDMEADFAAGFRAYLSNNPDDPQGTDSR